MIKRKILSKQM
jgi:tRNA-dihydrouridine synthase 1